MEDPHPPRPYAGGSLKARSHTAVKLRQPHYNVCFPFFQGGECALSLCAMRCRDIVPCAVVLFRLDDSARGVGGNPAPWVARRGKCGASSAPKFLQNIKPIWDNQALYGIRIS